MKEYTKELAKIDDRRSLVLWVIEDAEGKTIKQEYVVCSYYDATKPVGSQWCWGHYFRNLFNAVEYAEEISYARKETKVFPMPDLEDIEEKEEE